MSTPPRIASISLPCDAGEALGVPLVLLRRAQTVQCALGQTVPSLTLLVNSKTPWIATLHPTVEGQRDRGCCVKQCSPIPTVSPAKNFLVYFISIAYIEHLVLSSDFRKPLNLLKTKD